MNQAERRNREQATESDGKGRRREKGRAEGEGGIYGCRESGEA